MRKLLLIDSFALIHRAFHALPPLTTSKGEPAGAVYGFALAVLKALKDFKPDYVAAAFDLPQPTFRHQAYAEYQSHRPEMVSDMAQQIPKVRELLEKLGIKIFSEPGFEADDIIGTISKKMEVEPGLQIIILTGDKDSLQLVTDKTKVYFLRKGVTDTVPYGPKEVEGRFGFAPQLITDFKGLCGDPSDNIPGVPGIGEKTATALIKEGGSLEDIYKKIELRQLIASVRPQILEKLKIFREQAILSKKLATIERNVPLKITLGEISFEGINPQKLEPLLGEWGFKSLVARLNNDIKEK